MNIQYKLVNKTTTPDYHRYRIEVVNDLDAVFLFDQIYDEKGAIWCEMTVHVVMGNEEIRAVPVTRANLLNSTRSGYGAIVDGLTSDWPAVHWKSIVGDLVSESITMYRSGNHSVQLTGKVDTAHIIPFALDPFVAGGGVTVLYGEGGLGKSKLALTMALAIATGESLLGVPRVKGPVVYFDYEDDELVHQERLHALAAGYDLNVENVPIYHKRLVSSVNTSQSEMRRTVDEHEAVFCVLDSVGMGRGGSAFTSEDTVRMFRALRSFHIPVLAVDHVAAVDLKAKRKEGSLAKPYGTVYTINLARMLWSMELTDGPDSVRGTSHERWFYLTNTKANHVARQRPQGVCESSTADSDNRHLYGTLHYQLLDPHFSPLTDLQRKENEEPQAPIPY